MNSNVFYYFSRKAAKLQEKSPNGKALGVFATLREANCLLALGDNDLFYKEMRLCGTLTLGSLAHFRHFFQTR
jgi:hypothetical protein